MDDEDDSRARSARNLEPQTEAELIELEERARANRVAAIMARPAEPPRVVYKTRAADALLEGPAGSSPRPEAARAVSAIARPGAARSLAEDKLVEWWAERIVDLLNRMKKADMHEYAHWFLREIAGLDVANARRAGKLNADVLKRHRKLKQRVKAIEAAWAEQAKQAKPRVRVASGRLPQ